VGVTAMASTRHPVRLSGSVNEKLALPWGSAASSPLI